MRTAARHHRRIQPRPAAGLVREATRRPPAAGHAPFGRLLVAALGFAALCAGLAVLGAGCQQSPKDRLKDAGFTDRNPVGVPPEAKLVRHGAGRSGGMLDPNTWFAADDITFKPASNGRVWVVDELNGVVVYKAAMRANARLVVSPKENQILLDGAYVYGRRLPDEHGFLIYFAPDAGTTQPQDSRSDTGSQQPPTPPATATSDGARRPGS